jgi:RHS repeat-associated protein
LKYRGYYYDSETGFYYLNSRYYDPEIGRFLNADSVISGVGGDVLGYNLFAYCQNNPVNMSDPGGNLPKWAVKVAIGVGAVLAGAVIVAATAATGGMAAAFVSAAVTGLKAAAVAGAVGAAVGGTKAAIKYYKSTGSLKNSSKTILKGTRDGFANGFMTGGIMAGSSQALSGAFKVAAKLGAPTGRNGGLAISEHIRALSPNHINGFESGGTLLKIGSKYKNVRFDVGAKSLFHMNVQLAKKVNYHVPIGIFGSGFIGGGFDD